MLDPLLRVGRGGVIDEAAQLARVRQAVKHERIRRQAVAARAAGLLIIGLDVFGNAHVRDEADVGFVDAHAEGDRGHHDDAFFAEKPLLVAGTVGAIHAGVVSQRREAFPLQPGGGFVDHLARKAVDDARCRADDFRG